MWAVLERFGYKAAFKELNGSEIHRLENVITLDHNVHFFFDTLQLWLEPKVVSDSPPRANWSFNWVSRTYPTPTNSVQLKLIILTIFGRLL
jgi:hypothetical protein